jgi:hypothetical protein
MIKLSIFWIVFGLILFTTCAVFDQQIWARGYAIWDKAKDLILIGLLVQFTRKKYGNVFIPVFYLILLRLVWDLISWGTGLSVNNPKAVGILFITYSSYVIFKLIKKNG